VHDVDIFSHPEWFPQGRLQRYFTTHVFLHGLRRAQHVFCVSEDTRKNVLQLIPTLDTRLSVTYEGVNVTRAIKAKEERDDQVLIMGTVEPRKNISLITEVWPEVCRRVERSVNLVIAGKDGWGKVDIPAGESIRRLRDGRDRTIVEKSRRERFGRGVANGLAA
jgi:glycosyltransferase involved in cell wall biosynthesis